MMKVDPYYRRKAKQNSDKKKKKEEKKNNTTGVVTTTESSTNPAQSLDPVTQTSEPNTDVTTQGSTDTPQIAVTPAPTTQQVESGDATPTVTETTPATEGAVTTPTGMGTVHATEGAVTTPTATMPTPPATDDTATTQTATTPTSATETGTTVTTEENAQQPLVNGWVNLRRGSRGDDVKALQKALNVADDGIFGRQTEAAIKAFQKANGLLETGKIDDATFQKLNASVPASVTPTTSATNEAASVQTYSPDDTGLPGADFRGMTSDQYDALPESEKANYHSPYNDGYYVTTPDARRARLNALSDRSDARTQEKMREIMMEENPNEGAYDQYLSQYLTDLSNIMSRERMMDPEEKRRRERAAYAAASIGALGNVFGAMGSLWGAAKGGEVPAEVAKAPEAYPVVKELRDDQRKLADRYLQSSAARLAAQRQMYSDWNTRQQNRANTELALQKLGQKDYYTMQANALKNERLIESELKDYYNRVGKTEGYKLQKEKMEKAASLAMSKLAETRDYHQTMATLKAQGLSETERYHALVIGLRKMNLSETAASHAANEALRGQYNEILAAINGVSAPTPRSQRGRSLGLKK